MVESYFSAWYDIHKLKIQVRNIYIFKENKCNMNILDIYAILRVVSIYQQGPV